MKPSGVGGMAVIEGVMMKNKEEYAVAIRKPNNEIVIEKDTHKSIADKVKLFKLPIFRGMLAFVDSMVMGIKILNISANYLEDEEIEISEDQKEEIDSSKGKKSKDKNNKDEDNKVEIKAVKQEDNKKATTLETNGKLNHAGNKEEEAHSDNKDLNLIELEENKSENKESNALLMASAVFVSIIISVTLFMVTPVLISSLFTKIIDHKVLLSLLEGLIRIAIFILYVTFASQMKEIKRVFMYHGAEHKTINCIENGFDLTLENVRWQSKQHKRCGTSFMFLVMFISLVFFIFLPKMDILMRILSRVLLVPIIAGISYEFIRLAGKSENIIVDIISKPGMWIQNITTKEPDDAMIEVAISSVEAVFDWKSFMETSVTEEKDVKKGKLNKKEAVRIDKTSTKEEIAATSEIASSTVEDEEDDEILKALDKYLKTGGNNSIENEESK